MQKLRSSSCVDHLQCCVFISRRKSIDVTVQEQKGDLNADLLWSAQILMKRCNHYTSEGHQFTCNLGWELTLHTSHSFFIFQAHSRGYVKNYVFFPKTRKFFHKNVLIFSMLLHSITEWFWVEAAERLAWTLKIKGKLFCLDKKKNRSSTDDDVCYRSPCSLFYSALPHRQISSIPSPTHTWATFIL